MFFCLPIFFAAKSKMWFEFFFVPIIPLSSDHVWICSICQFKAPIQQPSQWEPQIAQNFGYYPPQNQNQNFVAPNHPGYQPAYVVQTPQK
ncbi:hypothetical protein ONZ45_g3200 [Pleurotus djamor]|nr:hypothetical protein ONZ45_g3200 [Pleurotus djamor]